MISKELLQEVLGEKYALHYKENNILYLYINGSSVGNYINIYELAHKCKEWAFSKGFEFRTSSLGVVDKYNHKDFCPDDGMIGEFFDCENSSKTEPEAIFKACQWILDNRDSK